MSTTSTRSTSVRSDLRPGDLVRVRKEGNLGIAWDGVGMLLSIYHQPQSDKPFGEILLGGQKRWVELKFLERVQDSERVVE